MTVRVKSWDIPAEGVEFEVRTEDGESHVGDVFITNRGVIWCPGKPAGRTAWNCHGRSCQGSSRGSWSRRREGETYEGRNERNLCLSVKEAAGAGRLALIIFLRSGEKLPDFSKVVPMIYLSVQLVEKYGHVLSLGWALDTAPLGKEPENFGGSVAEH